MENFVHNERFCLPSGFMGTYGKSLHILSGILWGLVEANMEFWSYIHLLFSSVSYSTLRVTHMSSGPI